MSGLKIYVLLMLAFLVSCSPGEDFDLGVCPKNENHTNQRKYGKGALLLSSFTSLAEFEEIVGIQYVENGVKISHCSNGWKVVSVLNKGVKESDFIYAREGNVFDRLQLVLRCPYLLVCKEDLLRIEFLGRRRNSLFGEGDVAFYDIAVSMVNNIDEEDKSGMTDRDLSEKGYLNTFNHVTAQAFMTTLFSERLADFTADIHERDRMPELVSGDFTTEQAADVENGVVDNYLDLVNNEWGQVLGEQLKQKYHIDRNTVWTRSMLVSYLNDIQRYYNSAFGIGMKPFREDDDLVRKFTDKLNIALSDIETLRNYYNI